MSFNGNSTQFLIHYFTIHKNIHENYIWKDNLILKNYFFFKEITLNNAEFSLLKEEGLYCFGMKQGKKDLSGLH